jgi:hypothetical protein
MKTLQAEETQKRESMTIDGKKKIEKLELSIKKGRKTVSELKAAMGELKAQEKLIKTQAEK